MKIQTCRFCKETIWPDQPMVRYSARHCAHPTCYLDAGKTLQELSKFQVDQIPFRILKDRGLVDLAREITKDIPRH